MPKKAKEIEAIDITAFEREQWARGKNIAGMDEAGRGPLAGPVAAACAIMPESPIINGITDSKLLTEKRRETLRGRIMSTAIDYSVALVDVDYINEYGIQAATLRAFTQAFGGMKKQPDCTFADYIVGLSLPTELRVFKGGDRLSYSIAAASILAKTERDAYMLKMHERYPEYGFIKHKGYGTALHIAAISAFGMCPLHRTQFVNTALSKPLRSLSKSDLGYLGERHAERYLNKLGMKTLARNYHAERAEIDLIMLDGETVVFVEVKTRLSDAFGTGAEAVTNAKQRSIIRCAAAYAREHDLQDTSMRFDVVEVMDSYITPTINHFDAAFSS